MKGRRAIGWPRKADPSESLRSSVCRLGPLCRADAAKFLCRLGSDLRQHDVDDKASWIAGEPEPTGLNCHFDVTRNVPSGDDTGYRRSADRVRRGAYQGRAELIDRLRSVPWWTGASIERNRERFLF